MNVGIPIRGLAIALSGVALALPSTAAAGNGGTAPAAPGGSGPSDGSLALTTQHTLFLGRTLEITGSDPVAASKTVSIELRQGSDPWLQIAAVAADSAGAFAATWRPTSYGEYQVRGVVAGEAQASSAGDSAAPSTVVVYKPATATWYGPGFYGKRTACGQRLTRRLVGVANRRLRCGTQVQLAYRGHTLVAPVVDRGPFAHGASWDLTGAAAKQLGMTVTSRIGAAPLNLPLQPPAL
jgi:rare lipoprotein A (peptidoglycan hydrolase)